MEYKGSSKGSSQEVFDGVGLMPQACNKCGKCCENITIVFSKRQIMNKLAKAVKEKREGDILEMSMMLRCFYWKYKRHDGQWVCSCIYYQSPAKGRKAKCLIHAGRPYICKNYPYGRAGIEKGCGYKGRKTK